MAWASSQAKLLISINPPERVGKLSARNFGEVDLTKSPEGRTVLVVEDEPFVRMIAAGMLQEGGFRVVEAPDATEALDLLERHQVAVVFTDINMPGLIDGLQLAAIVKERYPHVKVIITSGRQWLGSDALPSDSVFLPKPYRSAELSELVERQASRSD
ncbi:response regulator [Sphingomonas sp. ABOLE]|nr:response regulator [Sphingomonas sp. ABOLE]